MSSSYLTVSYYVGLMVRPLSFCLNYHSTVLPVRFRLRERLWASRRDNPRNHLNLSPRNCAHAAPNQNCSTCALSSQGIAALTCDGGCGIMRRYSSSTCSYFYIFSTLILMVWEKRLRGAQMRRLTRALDSLLTQFVTRPTYQKRNARRRIRTTTGSLHGQMRMVAW